MCSAVNLCCSSLEIVPQRNELKFCEMHWDNLYLPIVEHHKWRKGIGGMTIFGQFILTDETQVIAQVLFNVFLLKEPQRYAPGTYIYILKDRMSTGAVNGH
jgi:hypothetical protein